MSVTFTAYPFDGAPEIDVHNANGAALLCALGYAGDVEAGDLGGSADPGDMRGRVLVALALIDDGAPGDGMRPDPLRERWLEGGVSSGAHLAARLAEIGELAEWAEREGREVTWG